MSIDDNDRNQPMGSDQIRGVLRHRLTYIQKQILVETSHLLKLRIHSCQHNVVKKNKEGYVAELVHVWKMRHIPTETLLLLGRNLVIQLEVSKRKEYRHC